MSDIHELSALDLAAAVRADEVSPDDVVEHTLERAERLGPSVGAFAHLTPELAREQAAEATRRLREGGDLPPFLGVPVPVKDLSMVAGQPFEAGSAALRGYVAPADDGVTVRLREAGTLMVGKTTTPEFGLPPYTEPDVAAPARSPWDPRRSAGGCAGGARPAPAWPPTRHPPRAGCRPTPSRTSPRRHAARGPPAAVRADRPAAPGRPWPPGSSRRRTRATAAARSGSRPPPADSSD